MKVDSTNNSLHMNRQANMHAPSHNQGSPFALSLALLMCSATWFVGAFIWYLTQSQSKDGWSDTPLAEMLVLCLSPLGCIIVGFLLVLARRYDGERLTALDRCALYIGIIAVGHFSWLFAEVLRSMHAMGI
jgi:hypothetical protein